MDLVSDALGQTPGLQAAAKSRLAQAVTQTKKARRAGRAFNSMGGGPHRQFKCNYSAISLAARCKSSSSFARLSAPKAVLAFIWADCQIGYASFKTA